MVSRVRTVDFLPEVFQTRSNNQLLQATLDQITQEPAYRKAEGFIGRRVGPGVNADDSYVVEPTKTRTDFQLEPGVFSVDPNSGLVTDGITYPGILDALSLQGAVTSDPSRLFGSEYYTWDPFIDLDKFVNFSQYYWLPAGPDSVDVQAEPIPAIDDYTVTRGIDGYTFSGVADKNPILRLLRGGSYTFQINQTSQFWIQAAPGVSGKLPQTPNISSRDVYGVYDNGQNSGTVTFNVPSKTAQDFYFNNLTAIDNVDFVTDLKYSDINNIYVSDFLAQYGGIDGIQDLNNRTLIFTRRSDDAELGGWIKTTQFDPLIRTQPVDQPDPLNGQDGSYDSIPYDAFTTIDGDSLRYGIWIIQYIYDQDGNPYMTLEQQRTVAVYEKFSILYGDVYSSTQWYKDVNGYFEQIPLLTAAQDVLYYQDSTNPDIFGEIHLISQADQDTFNVNDVVGSTTYTSPNGVTFTNGLKVRFQGNVTPSSYAGKEYYVEGVGTGPGIQRRVGFINGEAYYGPWHLYQGRRMTGSVHSTTEFQYYIWEDVQESLDNYNSGGPSTAVRTDVRKAVDFVGNGIKLLPVTDFITPEPYTENQSIPFDSQAFDVGNFDGSLNQPLVQDYITINRASADLNAWTRSNRWFHIDVINATATYNELVPDLDQNLRAKRPIIEFRPDLKLYNSGVQAKAPVTIIDFINTDALSQVNGALAYNIDGVALSTGTRIIFAADTDPQVRNKIYEVEFISPDTVAPIMSQPVIHLVEASDAVVLRDQSVTVLSGLTQQGNTYRFDGTSWVLCQEKTSVNQEPLFDIFDADGISLSDQTRYPSSTFTGTKLFSYARGSGSNNDTVLGFPLTYLSLANIGDIVFENNLYKDTFLYVDNNVSVSRNISVGTVRQFTELLFYQDLIGWQPAATSSFQHQQLSFIYNNEPLILDVRAAQDDVLPAIKVFNGAEFVSPDQYTVERGTNSTTITFVNTPAVGDVIEVQVISDQVSQVGFYEVPNNLESNPFNVDTERFTLGTIRSHYGTIGENLLDLSGAINGSNNTRDLGNIIPFGTNILQQSSPMTILGYFLRQQNYDVMRALQFNNDQYIKFKNQMFDLITNNDYTNYTVPEVLDDVLVELSKGRTSLDAFYWSDMIPAGSVYQSQRIIYTSISDPTFDLSRTYDFVSSNYQAVLVYVNDQLLVKDQDYVVSATGPRLTITSTLVAGDVVEIREYATTYGNFVPNTPSKMGLYPAWKPEIYLDSSYIEPTLIIRGHDGSKTPAFGDFRDQVLLEFETRIYNNLKIKSNIPLTFEQVIPGRFRTTEYSLTEINEILAQEWFAWLGRNKIDGATQTYIPGNEFTYNYRQAGDKIDNSLLLGAYRGIYRYFYDTETPESTPWEMIGFSQKPSWWENEYGPTPYTGDNMVLWDDMAAGRVADPAGEYYLPAFVRPNLDLVIANGGEGQLLSPFDSVVGTYNDTTWESSWVFGDGGPAEAAWRNSSSYPFSIMKLLALTKPAEFYSLFADRDRYKYDDYLGQYLYDGRYRLNAKDLEIYGNGNSKASYLNWVVDYNVFNGRTNSSSDLTEALDYLQVRLAYRMAGFSDKSYIKIFTEKSSPNSLNSSLLIPDESYDILLYRNTTEQLINYSAVVVERVQGGYSVYGYNQDRPFFQILASNPNGATTTITAGGTSARVSTVYTDNVVRIPYGYKFVNISQVADFLLSYGKFLETQGLTFENVYNGTVLSWTQMAQEFVYWSNQGWSTGSLLNLNPVAAGITLEKPSSIVDSMAENVVQNAILDQGGKRIKAENLIFQRVGNEFSVRTNTDLQSISGINMRMTSYENMLVLANTSVFDDLIYDPATGSRQERVRLVASVSTEWTGLPDAPGFIITQDNVQEWQPDRKYAKGEIVLYKNVYYSAQTIVEPKATFVFSDWYRSDYKPRGTGLLANISNKADQLENAYGISEANLERDSDLLAFGLIGFRPRNYMQALNLDDISQVQLYRQFLGSKGTRTSAELFTFADLGKETAQYNIYEKWAIQRSLYGANASRNWIELQLNESLLQSNPSTIQIIEPFQSSEADQTVQLAGVWNTSQALTSTDILPSQYDLVNDTDLPTAGFVNIDDVNITVFDLTDPQSLSANLDSIGVGTKIWAAKSNSHDWNVYRASRVPGNVIEVSDNLNGTALVTFNAIHGLSTGNLMIIKYFLDGINGVYNVISVPSITSVIISYQFPGEAILATGVGLALRLDTMRVEQASDTLNLPYSTNLQPGALVWVDNNGSGHWEVLEKQSPFTSTSQLEIAAETMEDRFGSAVAQASNNAWALIGAPGYQTNGAAFAYVRGEGTSYISPYVITSSATGTSGFGSSLSVGDVTYAAVGAPLSQSTLGYTTIVKRDPVSTAFVEQQILVPNDLNSFVVTTGQFGYSVVVSHDERWLAVGAPYCNQVYVYGLVENETQSIEYTTLNNTTTYDIVDIQYDETTQLVVVLDNEILVEGSDYNIINGQVIFTSSPDADLSLIITRLNSVQLDAASYYSILADSTSGSGSQALWTVDRQRGTYSVNLVSGGQDYAISDTLTINAASVGGGVSPTNDITITVDDVDGDGAIIDFSVSGSGVDNTATFSLNEYLYNVTSIDSIKVVVNGNLYRPHIDYDFNADDSSVGQDITFLTVPPAGARIDVSCLDYYDYVTTIAREDLTSDARFGFSLAMSTDGRQIMIGVPYADNTVNGSEVNASGKVYVYDRSVERQLVIDPTIRDYTVTQTPVGTVNVKVNGVYLQDADRFIDGQFTIAGSTVTFNSNITLNRGDVIEIDTNQFQVMQEITATTPTVDAHFGWDVDLCPNNCSLYVGSPEDSRVNPGGGSVQRSVNQSRIYGIITGTTANPTLTPGDTIRINNVVVELYSTNKNGVAQAPTVASLVQDIINAGDETLLTSSDPSVRARYRGLTNVTPSVTDGKLTLTVSNSAAAQALNKMTVLPGSGTMWDDLGMDPFEFTQTIVSPYPIDYSGFGRRVLVDSEADNLVVSAPAGTLIKPTTFDSNTTTFDSFSTNFADAVERSGVVYTFDYLPSAVDTVLDPGKFVFGQQIYDNNVSALDEFGADIDYTNGLLIVGSPGDDLTDSLGNYGRAALFYNANRTPAWTVKYQQTPSVDIRLINTVFMYDKTKDKVLQYFDYFDPLQGKILGAARQNIDYIGSVDPADYNALNQTVTQIWNVNHVGKVWWDTTNVRFIDPNQDSVPYAARRWGQIFPGSSVDVYRWTESTVPPASYTGPGIVYSTDSYSVNTSLNDAGTFTTTYYFWVRNITTIDTEIGKTLSVASVASYIENPRGSGVSYIAPINSSTVAIYNAREYLDATDTVLHIEYDEIYNDNNVHSAYDLITVDDGNSFVSAPLFTKLTDSFCGVDSLGNLVPDPNLSLPNRYGVQYRPRQSMFINRFTALENYLTYVNSVMKLYPITESRRFTLLNSSEPEPTASSYNKRVADLTQLGYQNLDRVDFGYKYLVASDSSNRGLWTIYEVTNSGSIIDPKTLSLVRVQNYDTRRYWNYIDWYSPGFNSSTKPEIEIATVSELSSLSVDVGTVVRVTANASGKFEIYLYTDAGWERVGLEDGTIEFDASLWDYNIGRFGFDSEVFDAQYFDQEPVLETRKIIQAINEELLIDDLLLERNRALILMFEYINTEFQAPEWLIKTSLVDVEHRIRELVPFQTYRQDNQDFVLQYINEVKPYHTQIRQFFLRYEGNDQANMSPTDFDLPAYYDTLLEIPQYVSPILDDSGQLSPTSSVPSNAAIWSTWPYSQWFDNYKLSLDSVTIVNGGTGFTTAPTLTVVGTATTPAVLQARINSAGAIVGVEVITPGAGYLSTPTIEVSEATGTGAVLVPVMSNGLVRSITTTIKYDRYEYVSQVTDWHPDVSYDNGDLVRYQDRVWRANAEDSSAVLNNEFDPDQWQAVAASELTGLDRTRGYYLPGVNQPGLDLPLLIDGLDYPGVQVQAPSFSDNTGFDVGFFDATPFDNLDFGPEGLPTYDPNILDAEYYSDFLDIYLGTRSTDINVDGGGFVDTYSSHAPEELVPGIMFDTLDFRVYTRPGADWLNDGHGFPSKVVNFVFSGTPMSFDGLVDAVIDIQVTNQTTGLEMIPGVQYTVNWPAQAITVAAGATAGDVITITAYALGGGNQLYNVSLTGDKVNNRLEVPVEYNQIEEIVVFLDGEQYTNFTFEDNELNGTSIIFGQSFGPTQRVTVGVLGSSTDSIYASWSAPVYQRFTITDSSTLVYDLDNSMQGTNPSNLIVLNNGRRARPSEGVRHIADGSSIQYLLPNRGGYSQGLIADNDVSVFLENQPLTLGVDFFVDPYLGGNERTITLAYLPETGDEIQIYVRTKADYTVNTDQITFRPSGSFGITVGDRIEIISFNDTSEQGMLTQVFVGPVTTGATVNEPFDSTDFDTGSISGDPGSFDYTVGTTISLNDFDLGATITDPSRLWVTLNGLRLQPVVDFTLSGTELILGSGVIGNTDVLAVTQFTNNVVPDVLDFRVFTDLRGVSATYRITDASSTVLTAPLGQYDDIIYVQDASRLSYANLDGNTLGILFVNGERIMYRERDTVNNTLSGLNRGTAGTAAAAHDTGSTVTNGNAVNLLYAEYQDRVIKDSTLADGSTKVFTAPSIELDTVTQPTLVDAPRVYVGGELQTAGYTITGYQPVTVLFDTAPADGRQVDIEVIQGKSWYDPGVTTASDGVPLQDATNRAARFLRGE